MTAKQKDPKANGVALTIPEKFAVMSMVRSMGTQATSTDTEIAKQASDTVKRPVHVSTIKQYREAFGVGQFKAPPQADLLAEVRRLQRELALRETGQTSGQVSAAV